MKLSPSASKLARWFGEEQLADVGAAMRGWYGPPIVLGLSPGRIPVRAHADGDFSGGPLEAGGFSSLLDHIDELTRAALRSPTFSTGFSGVADVILRAATLRRVKYTFQKNGQSAVIANSCSWWQAANQPAAGGQGAATPNGTAQTSATTGALNFTDAQTGQAAFFGGGNLQGSGTVGGAVLCYDRIFAVAKTMNSTATEAVTGVPTRYQGAQGAVDSGEGNFCFPEVFTVLPATAHNHTVCQYTRAIDGTTGRTFPSIAGVSSQATNRVDLPTGSWFMPLEAGDVGVRALSQLQCDAAIATGSMDFVIGHPIGWLPSYSALATTNIDGIRRPFQLGNRIFNGACLSFLEIFKPVANNTTWAGAIDVFYG